MDPILVHNTLKLVEQIVYMLIIEGLLGSAVDFSEENQEFYWPYCRYTVYVVSMIVYDVVVLLDSCLAQW